MEIVKASAEEFDSVSYGKPRGPHSETGKLVLSLGIGDVVRIKGHEHNPSVTAPGCKLQRRLLQVARSQNRKLSCRHDGADLLVKRVK